MKLTNPYSMAETIEMLRYFFTAQGRVDPLELLEKAIIKSHEDMSYAKKMEAALLRGGSIEYRDLFSEFGEYFEAPRAEFPFYPHHDAVNGIDTAMLAIKREAVWPGAMLDSIESRFSYDNLSHAWSI